MKQELGHAPSTDNTADAGREGSSSGRVMLRLEERARRAERDLSACRNELDVLRVRNMELQDQIAAMRHSTSWRITRPVRAARYALAGLRPLLRRLLRSLVYLPMHVLLRRPRIRRLLGAVTRRVPWLHARLSRLAQNPSIRGAVTSVPDPDAPRDAVEARMTVDARRVLRKLRADTQRRDENTK